MSLAALASVSHVVLWSLWGKDQKKLRTPGKKRNGKTRCKLKIVEEERGQNGLEVPDIFELFPCLFFLRARSW